MHDGNSRSGLAPVGEGKHLCLECLECLAPLSMPLFMVDALNSLIEEQYIQMNDGPVKDLYNFAYWTCLQLER